MPRGSMVDPERPKKMTDEERQKDAWKEALEFYAAELEKRIVELEMKYGAPAGMLEAADIADSFGDRHEENEIGDAIRARAAEFNPHPTRNK